MPPSWNLEAFRKFPDSRNLGKIEEIMENINIPAGKGCWNGVFLCHWEAIERFIWMLETSFKAPSKQVSPYPHKTGSYILQIQTIPLAVTDWKFHTRPETPHSFYDTLIKFSLPYEHKPIYRSAYSILGLYWIRNSANTRQELLMKDLIAIVPTLERSKFELPLALIIQFMV